ncbi:MAG: hypothetical protein JJT75_01305 [Opitutales bacterium]|nr:hypothetical protein [Opitutales bacterium]MCH8541015.1 hypothetical protein [Opitutales bacterium]
MNKDYRWTVLFLCSLVGWFFWQEINHFLSPVHLSLYLGGLLITFGILRLPLYSGLIHSVLIATWLDAASPTYPFGTGILAFALLHLGIYTLRRKISHDTSAWMILTALLVNFLLFLFWTVYHYPRQIDPSGYLWRSLVDLVISQIATTIVAVWFFSLQNALLNLCHMPLDEESPLSP